MRLIHVLPLTFALAACGTPADRWEKAGAGPSAVNEAMQECRIASRLSPEPHLGTPTPRTTGTPGMDRMEDRDGREAAQFQQCMLGKGYSTKR